jgi:hypothetical protein
MVSSAFISNPFHQTSSQSLAEIFTFKLHSLSIGLGSGSRDSSSKDCWDSKGETEKELHFESSFNSGGARFAGILALELLEIGSRSVRRQQHI